MLSKDKQNYENIYTVSEGLPQKPSSDYNSGQFGSNKEYRYIRFKITAERTYWHMGEFEIYAISSKATINTEYSTVKAEDAEALYDLMVIAKGVYDNSIDNSELDAMYKRLNERYNAVLKSSGINGTAYITANKDTVYDLSGRKQEKTPKKGIYIVNGKKILVK